MPCTTSALASLVIVVSSIYMNYAIASNNTMQKYESSLSPELREIYQKIVKERHTIYVHGYAIGFLLSTIYLLYNSYILKHKFNTYTSVSIVILISYITNHLYYMLMPKTDHMLNHLEKKEEVQAWSQMYNYMKYQFHLSFLVGIIALGIYAYTFC